MKKNHKDFYLFVGIFLFSFLSYAIFLYYRGFGWDGDSVVNAAQFSIFLNPNLYGSPPMIEAVPRVFCIILFGIIYKITGNFHLLTFLSIAINAFVIAVLCKWVSDVKGCWFITLIGIITQATWYYMVIDCDNKAFSIPVAILALYFYFHLKKKHVGSFLLLISNLFRPGAEIIIFLIICYELLQGKKNIFFLSFCLAIGMIHTNLGIFLIFPNKETVFKFWHLELVNLNLSIVKNLIYGTYLYMNSIFRNIFYAKSTIVWAILAACGVLRIFREKNTIMGIFLLPTTTVIGLGMYIFYSKENAMQAIQVMCTRLYLMPFVLIVPVLAAFFPYQKVKILNNNFKIVKRYIYPSILVITLSFTIFLGHHFRGRIETHTNGSGINRVEIVGGGWRQFKDISRIVKQETDPKQLLKVLSLWSDSYFLVLDIGNKIRELHTLHKHGDKKKLKQIFRSLDSFHFGMDNINVDAFDLLLLPKQCSFPVRKAFRFKKFILDGNRRLYIKTG